MASSPYALLIGLGLLLGVAAAANCGSGSGTTGGAGGAGGNPTTSSSSSTSASSSSSSSGTGGATSSSSSSSGTGGTGGMGDTWPPCHDCLQMACKDEIAACDADCIGIQACLDSVCAHLSMLGAPDEGQCQVHCQMLHFASKQKHLDVVNCALSASQCMPPCSGYSYDWDQCTTDATLNQCKPALEACNASSDCLSYQTCASGCTTNAACQACASTPEGAAGEQLYEAYWNCVETSCLAEGWLPSF